MTHVFRMKDVFYDLPQEKVGIHPAERGQSRMLLMNKCNDTAGMYLKNSNFLNIMEYLPANAHLILNDSKVVNARLWVTYSTENDDKEKRCEVMLLNPDAPTVDPRLALASPACNQIWSCMIRKLCQVGEELRVVSINGQDRQYSLRVRVVSIEEVWEEEEFDTGTGCKVEILVPPDAGSISMGEALSHHGDVPIPPYLYRDTTPSDQEDYQTVYASKDRAGSVAAPTAGLHFTTEVLQALEGRGVDITRMALHVSAGTFKPVTVDCISEHTMHEESFTVNMDGLLHLAKSYAEKRPILAVGTTSVRVSESLYWLGLKNLLHTKGLSDAPPLPLSLSQWEPSQLRAEWQSKTGGGAMPSPLDAFTALSSHDKGTGISGTTALCVAPGYQFMVVRDGLLTNFHQPDSTLMLLVAAFLGEGGKNNGVPALQRLYKHAIDENYRFLSYGDCCLLTKYDVGAIEIACKKK